MKKIEVNSAYLKKRLWGSITTGVLLFLIAFSAFKYVQLSSRKIDGTPSLLRHSFIWNEKVWSQLSSHKKLSVSKPIPKRGVEPRVNGEIGMQDFQDEADLKNYSVEVLSGPKKIILPVSVFHLSPKVGYSTDFRCIEGWSEEIQFAGARFSDFIKFYDLGKKEDGSYFNYVGFETPDKKYYVSIDMESMLHPQTLLAYEMNQEPLSEDNGAPLRLIIPIKYGIKSLKRIGKIVFSDTRPPDYWAERGYDWYSGF